MSQTGLEDACFESRAKELGLTPAELCDKEFQIHRILEKYIPARSQELYEHITNQIINVMYNKEEKK
jgi:hypothetical protein